MFSGKGTPKIRSKPTEEDSRQSAISIKPLCNSIQIIPRQGRPPQIHCILSEHPPSQEYLWATASEEREVSKSLYKKVYIKVYKNLLEWNIVYIFIKIINPQNFLYIRWMKYLVNRPISHKFYMQNASLL